MWKEFIVRNRESTMLWFCWNTSGASLFLRPALVNRFLFYIKIILTFKFPLPGWIFLPLSWLGKRKIMLEIFRELRGLLHVSHVHIDSWVFRLHYSVTTTCMFAFSLIVSAKQYVGNPIDCIHTKDIPEVKTNILNRHTVVIIGK